METNEWRTLKNQKFKQINHFINSCALHFSQHQDHPPEQTDKFQCSRQEIGGKDRKSSLREFQLQRTQRNVQPRMRISEDDDDLVVTKNPNNCVKCSVESG